jgi:pyruvate/2-oxoacid:ferredoxin oxidoreductase alpha subunit
LLLGFFLPTVAAMTAAAAPRESPGVTRAWDIATKLLVPLSIGMTGALLHHEIAIRENIVRVERMEDDIQKQEIKLDLILRGLNDVSSKITRVETILEKR